MFIVKKIISLVFDVLLVNFISFRYLNKKTKNNYIRIINYHETPQKHVKRFQKQLHYFSKKFENVDHGSLRMFLNGQKSFDNRPGLIISFDDGFLSNFDFALENLEKFGFTGWFMVSSDLVGMPNYMNPDNLCELLNRGHVIGCHTASHHRFNTCDSNETLDLEIIKSKNKLESFLNKEIDIFCWPGGEEIHYTAKAAEMIVKAKYNYSFLTNSFPVFANANPYTLERTNIDSSWPLFLVRFQLSGIMDKKYKCKRERVEKIIINAEEIKND